MNLKHRRILYISFILIFIILVPITIFYAAGYRYNFKQNKIEKTGILYIDSKPKHHQTKRLWQLVDLQLYILNLNSIDKNQRNA